MKLERVLILGCCVLAAVSARRRQRTNNDEEVVFYEDPDFSGSKLFVKLGAARCYTMKKDWDNRISSVDTKGRCLIGWDNFDCTGISIKLSNDSIKRAAGRRNLANFQFDKKISSISVCPSERRFRNFHSSDSGLDIWKVGLEEHNKYRKLHGVKELLGSVDLHRKAQGHADYLAKQNKFEASSQTQHGENLATSYETDKLDAIRDVVKRWYEKIHFYNFQDPNSNKNVPKTGQFSSIVWKSTTKLGVGVSWNKIDRKWIVVCMYSPPAATNRYAENVPRPLKSRKI